MHLNPLVPTGRISRRIYIPATLALNFLMSAAFSSGSDALAISGLALIWPSAMLAIQRAHDIGKPAWFAIIWIVLASIAGGVGEMDSSSNVLVWIGLASVIAAFAMGCVLAFRRGDVGENDFGPDPRNPRGAEVLVFE